jgi:hypothetical protein
MPSCGMWHRVGLVKTDVSKERVSSIFRVEKLCLTVSFVRVYCLDCLDNVGPYRSPRPVTGKKLHFFLQY